MDVRRTKDIEMGQTKLQARCDEHSEKETTLSHTVDATWCSYNVGRRFVVLCKVCQLVLIQRLGLLDELVDVGSQFGLAQAWGLVTFHHDRGRVGNAGEKDSTNVAAYDTDGYDGRKYEV